MIYVSENKSILCKGDYRPARFYKGKKKIAGYETISFEGEGTISLENCYNDKLHNVKIYGDAEGVGDLVGEGENSGKYKIGIAKKNSVNLFDKNNPNIISGYIDGSSLNIAYQSKGRLVWIEIEPNTTYRITKLPQSGICALSSVEPRIDAKVDVRYNVVNDLGGTSADYTVTTGANHKYLVVAILSTSTNTYTEQEMIDSLYIQKVGGAGDGLFDIYLDAPLWDGEYIDFEKGKVVRENSEEVVELPVLLTQKGTTTYQVDTTTTAKIIGEYKRKEV